MNASTLSTAQKLALDSMRDIGTIPGLSRRVEVDHDKNRVIGVVSFRKLRRCGGIFRQGDQLKCAFAIDPNDPPDKIAARSAECMGLIDAVVRKLPLRENRKVWIMTGTHIVELTKDAEIGKTYELKHEPTATP